MTKQKKTVRSQAVIMKNCSLVFISSVASAPMKTQYEEPAIKAEDIDA